VNGRLISVAGALGATAWLVAPLLAAAAQTPTRLDVVKPEHQARVSRDACAIPAPMRVKPPSTAVSPQGTWSALVRETDPTAVPYDQARACLELRRRDGAAVRYITLGDFRTLRVEWLDERQLRLVTDVGHVAGVSQLFDVEREVWIHARTEYYSVSTPADAFPIVNGDGYRGAIISASSVWHVFAKTGLQILTGQRVDDGVQVPGWTPSADDIAIVERNLTAFVQRAANDPPQVMSLVPGPARSAAASQLPWLRSNLTTLTRQYYGVTSGDSRRVLIHAFHADSVGRWRTEPIVIMDGGCGNAWFEFNFDRRQFVRFHCGALAAPVGSASGN
jgi:hypothetical protein